MTRCYVVCEGQTEETFIRDVIAPILAYQQIYLIAQLIPTSKTGEGGALNYDRVKRFVTNLLNEKNNPFVTTFFDLYALDNQFPDFSNSQKQIDIYAKVNSLEQAFKADIAQENFSFLTRFFPYIQPYEFEGLLFSDITKLIEVEPEWSKLTKNLKTLQSIRDNVKTPEHINDGYDTKPSARLEKLLSDPKYKKTYHGTLAIKEIGIDKLQQECSHFAQWYTNLLKLK